MRLIASLPVTLLATLASAQSFTIDFNNLTRGVTLSTQYVASNGVNFVPNAFSGPNVNNTAEPWATNTGLTVSDYVSLDPARPGYSVGTPMLFDGNLVRTINDYLNEDGDPSVLTTFASPITTATVTFVGIVFGTNGARDTQLIALDASNNILAQTRAVGRDTTNQQNLTVNVPSGFSRLAIVPGNFNDVVGFDNLVYTPVIPMWNVDASGDYFVAGNWSTNTVPVGATATARFGNVITQPRSVSFSNDVVVDRMIFDSDVSYTLSTTPNPSGFVRDVVFAGAHNELDVVRGIHNISRVSSSTGITKTGAGAVSISRLSVSGNVAVNEGSLSLSGGSSLASKVGSVSVADGAQLFLGTTPLIATAMTENAVRQLLLAGKIATGGSPPNLKIGYRQGLPYQGGNTIGGELVAASDVVIRATLPGDATLDLHVNFDDLLVTAMNYARTDTTWYQADFNYDGATDFADLLAVAQNYGASALTQAQLDSLDAAFLCDYRIAASLVPEPSTALATAAAFLMLRRRVAAEAIS